MYRQFASDYVQPRDIGIWVPDTTREPGSGPGFPVIYVQDGQHLFSSCSRFGGWRLDKAMQKLAVNGIIQPAIIVGIWSTSDRWREYAPKKAVERYVPKEDQQQMRETGYFPTSDHYLSFIIHELKPFVEANYPILAGPQHTFLMGSSMGGIISVYAVCEYPRVFGGAACLSTHWPVSGGAMVPYLKEALPEPDGHNFYYDLGTWSVDREYGPFQKEVDKVMQYNGYTEHQNWITHTYKGHMHSAIAWGSRVHVPLTFFLSTDSNTQAVTPS